MVTTNIDLPMDRIAAFCKKWKIREFALFGSVLRDDFRPDSDIDVLATFEPDPGWSLFDHVDMEDELSEMLGRRAEVADRQAVKESRNPWRRYDILTTARVIYAA